MAVAVVFIAGPYRGATPWDVEQNVRRAEALALRVAGAGAMPLCPHANTRFFDKQLTDEFWLAGIQELLRRCDAVALVDGWERSAGARAEVALAEGLGIPVLHEWAGEALTLARLALLGGGALVATATEVARLRVELAEALRAARQLLVDVAERDAARAVQASGALWQQAARGDLLLRFARRLDPKMMADPGLAAECGGLVEEFLQAEDAAAAPFQCKFCGRPFPSADTAREHEVVTRGACREDPDDAPR